ncbi:MAG: BTAD domain-containing putative transcriptional regulator [Paracoccaceae bacterium]
MDCSLRISLETGVKIIDGERSVTELSGKRAALIAVISLEAPKPVDRDHLANLLWTKDNAQSRTSFRQELSKLRRTLSDTADLLFRETEFGFQLNDKVEVDVLTALEQACTGHFPELLAENPGALCNMLPGFEFLDHSFASWMTLKRQRMHQDMVDFLTKSLSSLDPKDENNLRFARTLNVMEPTHEAAVRFMMLHYCMQGETTTALRLYERLWHELWEEYEVRPSEPTQDLVVAIKSGESLTSFLPRIPAPTIEQHEQTAPDPEILALAEEPATCLNPIIWIAQFENSLQRPEFEKPINGLRLDLASALSRFREWKVIDRKELDPETMVRNPGIHSFILSGACSDADECGKIIVNFHDCDTKQLVWSESLAFFDADWTRLKRRAIRRVALAMNLHLAASRIQAVPDLAEIDLPGREAWLLGQTLLLEWRPESDDKAEQIFRQLLHNNPRFAAAQTGLAQILNSRHHMRPGTYRNRKDHLEALMLSNQAVSVDPLDSRAQLTLAWSYAMLGNWDIALATFKIAFELNENDPWTLVSGALGFSYCGDRESARQLAELLAEIGLGISPLQWAYHAGVQFMEGNYEAAVAAAERGTGSTPYIAGWHAAALAHMGEVQAAQEVFGSFLDTIRADWYGDGPADNREITQWLLHCYPIRGSDDWKLLRDGLALAGGPYLEQSLEIQPLA